jgi:hypothetical protein
MKVVAALFLLCSVVTVRGQNLRGVAPGAQAQNVSSRDIRDVDPEEDGDDTQDVSAQDQDDSEERILMRSTDLQRGCFGARNKANYFARNPFSTDRKEQRAFGRRGDWAKCLPSPSFAMMCKHAVHHGLNPEPLQDQESEDTNSKKHRGQKHDWHAGVLYETLLEMHERNVPM